MKTENSEIGRRLLDSSYDFKYFNKHETQQFFSVYRAIDLNIYFKIKYILVFYTVVFLFQSCLVLAVVKVGNPRNIDLLDPNLHQD